METTDPPASLLYREVRDRRGRVYRVGESAAELTGRGRIWMAVLPWVGTTGIACAAYVFVAAQNSLAGSRRWDAGFLWPAALWALSQMAVALPAGRLRESGRLSARAAVTAGAFGASAGCLTLALAPGPTAARLASAVLGGAGAGLVHATCLTLPGKWYPERRGGPTGFVASGLAFGAVPLLPGLGALGAGADRPAVPALTGAAVCLVVAAAGRLLRDPPRDWWPPHADPLTVPADPVARRVREKNPPAVRQYSPQEAARTPVWWLMWLCLLGAAGVTVLGLRLLTSYGRVLGQDDGTWCAVVAGGVVSAGAGALSDRLGRRTTLSAVCLLLGLAQFGAALAGRTGSGPLLLGCAAATGLAGGAALALVTALAADHFGENHSAGVHGLLAVSWLLPVLAGFGTSAAAAAARDPRGAFLVAGCTALACAVLALFLKAPGRPSARRIVPNPHPLGEEMA
ncbi:MFS transporter [Streptomyces sp. NPDC047869]|uniref:MFS transporter n=1 Tax=Streptomyces sp. NPDC047869 TaxID=3154709 RepID=UPI003454835F